MNEPLLNSVSLNSDFRKIVLEVSQYIVLRTETINMDYTHPPHGTYPTQLPPTILHSSILLYHSLQRILPVPTTPTTHTCQTCLPTKLLLAPTNTQAANLLSSPTHSIPTPACISSIKFIHVQLTIMPPCLLSYDLLRSKFTFLSCSRRPPLTNLPGLNLQ